MRHLLAALRLVSEKVGTFEEALDHIKRNFGDYTGYFNPNLPAVEEELRNGLGKATKVYRCVSYDVGEDWVASLRAQGTGIYWSFNPEAASCHWGSKPVRVFLEADLPPSGVNWIKTIEMNLHHRYAAEEEVRLSQNSSIRVISGRVVEKGKAIETVGINETFSTGSSGTDDQ